MRRLLFFLLIQPIFFNLNAQKIIYVDADQTNTPDGISWSTAFTDLQSAINFADEGDQIWIKSGSYSPGTERTATYEITKAIKIYGGFAGTEVSPEERNLELNKTLLDGEIGDPENSEDNIYHLLTTNETIDYLFIDGLVFQNAFTNESEEEEEENTGGAIKSKADSLIIENCEFINNQAQFSGGAIHCEASYAKVDNSFFKGNSSPRTGSILMSCINGYLEVTNSRFTEAEQIQHNIHADSCDMKVSNCIFYNQNSIGTGMISNFSRNNFTNISDCIYENNENVSFAYILGSIDIENIVIRNNEVGGQGMFLMGEFINIKNVHYENNISSQAGAFYFATQGRGKVNISKSKFIESTGGSNGIFYFHGSKLTLDSLEFRNISSGSQATCFYAVGDTLNINETSFKDISGGSSGIFYSYITETMITNSIFEDCQSNSQAGTFTSSTGALTITNTDYIRNKTANGSTGTFMAYGNFLKINNCNFIENSASNQYGCFYADSDSIIIENSNFIDNRAGNNGAAFAYFPEKGIKIKNCNFIGNELANHWSYGGAIFGWTQNDLIIEDCTFKNNVAGNGAAVYCSGNVLIFRSEFIGNTSTSPTSQGGAFYASGDLTCIGNVFYRNKAFEGGAIYKRSSDDLSNLLINNTFIENSSFDNRSGALYYPEDSYVTLTNNLIWNNGDSSIYFTNNIGNVSNNQNVSDDGQWLPSAEYSVELMENFMPAASSAMVDYGLNPDLDIDYSTDIYGNPRIQGNSIDVGAVESPFLQEYVTLAGTVYYDKDGNCEKDEETKGIRGVRIVANPGEFFTQTGTNGNYTFKLKPDTYTLTQEITQNRDLINPVCPAENLYSNIVLDEPGKVVSGFDFYNDMPDCDRLDVEILAATKRNCFSSSTRLTVTNLSGVRSDAQVLKLNYPSGFGILDSNPIIESIDVEDATMTYTIPELNSLEKYIINIQDSVLCDPSAQNLGTTHLIKAEIDGIETCSTAHPEWSGAWLTVSAACEEDFIRFEIHNTGTGNMDDHAKVRIFQNETIVYENTILLEAGASEAIEIEAVEGPLRIEAEQVPFAPSPRKTTITITDCLVTDIDSSSLGIFTLDNLRYGYDEQLVTIVGSYDPNEITVSPKGWGPEGNVVLRDVVFTYTIHFQNTGNDTAFVVRLIDTLPAGLDISSLEFLDASHDFHFEQSGENSETLKWTFNNILLVDSTTNEEKSHGHVKFRIKPKTDLAIGTEIKNQVDIYFDFNLPIRTNTVLNTIQHEYPYNTSAVVVREQDINSTLAPSGGSMSFHPNPVQDELYLHRDFNKVEVTDAQGQIIFSSTDATRTISTHYWKSGMYLLILHSNENVETHKILKF
ncbi:MAG: right-handed parallel beta-helix repeat-containing protein [Cytophagaceae bacterium]